MVTDYEDNEEKLKRYFGPDVSPDADFAEQREKEIVRKRTELIERGQSFAEVARKEGTTRGEIERWYKKEYPEYHVSREKKREQRDQLFDSADTIKLPSPVNKGDYVEIIADFRTNPSHSTRDVKRNEGKVVAVSDHLFTIMKPQGYRESFRFQDVAQGTVSVKKTGPRHSPRPKSAPEGLL